MKEREFIRNSNKMVLKKVMQNRGSIAYYPEDGVLKMSLVIKPEDYKLFTEIMRVNYINLDTDPLENATLFENSVAIDVESLTKRLNYNFGEFVMLGSYNQLERLLKEGYINYDNLLNREESCPYKPIFNCEECDGDIKNFYEKCPDYGAKEALIELSKECPNCKKGILNPTDILTMECDKCSYREVITERELF
jgi:ribosomal protein S27AE